MFSTTGRDGSRARCTRISRLSRSPQISKSICGRSGYLMQRMLSSPVEIRSFGRRKNYETEGQPGATAQRPQLSRVVLAHTSRQLRSWLTWDVRHLFRWPAFFAMKESFQPEFFGVAVLPAVRLGERMHFPVESALAFCTGGDSRVVFGDVFGILSQR